MAVTQYIGSRYVPAFADPIEWSSDREYEPLTIVTYNGNSFTSKQTVPNGISIDNDDYWVSTGIYDNQIEQYRRETARVSDSLADVQDNIDSIGDSLPSDSFSASATVKNYIDSTATRIEEIIPVDSFSASSTVKDYVDESCSGVTSDITRIIEAVSSVIPAVDFDANSTVKDYIDNSIDSIDSIKVNLPTDPYSKFGNINQVLATLANGATKWVDPVAPTDAQAEQYITQWLNNHPEATTTVGDGTITDAKIASQPFTQDTNPHTIFHRNVPSGTDVNGWLGTYFYILPFATVYENSPIPESNRRLFMVLQSAYNYFAQIMINITTGEMYTRYSSTNGATWGNWVKYIAPITDGAITDAKIAPQPYTTDNDTHTILHRIPINGTDLNTYLGTCFVVLPFSTEYDNCPIEANTRRLLVSFQGGPNYYVQLIFNVPSGECFSRVSTSGGVNWTEWTTYAPDIDLVDTPNIYSISPSANGYGTKANDTLRIMTYNVCQYDNDTQVDISDQQLANLKMMILDANCDVMGWQESTATINDNTTDDKSALNYVFYPIYPYVYRPNGNSLASKIPFVSGSQEVISLTSGRPFCKAAVNINGKVVSVYTVHTVPGFTANAIAARETDLREIKTALDNDPNVYKIVCGDFNIASDETSVFDTIFSDYQHVNGGYAGWFETTGRYMASRGTEYPNDNIIFTPNIQLSNMKVYKEWYSSLYSDHIPIAVEFRLV